MTETIAHSRPVRVADPPQDDLAAQVAELAAGVDALDRGVIEAGVTASRALARADDALGYLYRLLARHPGHPGHPGPDLGKFPPPRSATPVISATPVGHYTLAGDDLVLVLDALAFAAEHKRDLAENCDESPLDGDCESCSLRLAIADEYESLARLIGGAR